MAATRLDLSGRPVALGRMRGLTASLTGGLLLACAAQAQPALDVPPIIPLPKAGPAAPPPLEPRLGPPPCAPEKLTRVIVRNVSPGLAAAAPAAQPRTLWRQGSTFLRSEESPDPTRGQPVVIIAEPDIWTVDMATQSGQHQVDPGPELVVRAPILPAAPDLPPPFRTLEFGCEVAFLTAAGAMVPRQTVPWGATKATVHQVTSGEHTVSILLGTRRQVPLMVAYARSGQPVFALRYDDYRDDLPDRPGLFAEPAGMKFDGGKPPPPKRRSSQPMIDPMKEFRPPTARRPR